MTKKQYYNIIKHTIENNEIEKGRDSLDIARAILNNMGVALPNGNCKEVAEILESNDYMYWRSCEPSEIRDMIDSGNAVIGVNDSEIIVVTSDIANSDSTTMMSRSVSDLSEEDYSNMSYYSYSNDETTTINYDILAEGTYYMNNRRHGKYFHINSGSVNMISGTISSLGNSIQWIFEKTEDYYTIKAAHSSGYYLCADNSNNVSLWDADEDDIPDNCKWDIKVANGGGMLIKNADNSMYLGSNDNGDIMMYSTTGEFGTDEYFSKVWRVINKDYYSAGNTMYREMSNETKFSNIEIAFDKTAKLSIVKYYGNELWTNYYDFSYSFEKADLAYIDMSTGTIVPRKLNGENPYGGGTIVEATHKVTGIKLSFYVIIGFSSSIVSTPLASYIPEALSQPYDVWPASEESIYHNCSSIARTELLKSIIENARITVIGGNSLGYYNAASMLSHYLNNTGTMYTVDVGEMIKKWGSAQNYKNQHLNWLISAIEVSATTNNKTLKTIVAFDCDIDETTDWGRSVGTYTVSIDCTYRKTSNNSYTASINYELHDAYDWNPAITDMGNLPVSPREMWELHHGGRAKNYEVYGNEILTMTWSNGQTINNGVIIS